MFPMKFFEYLAAGLPVVATDLESIREFNKLVAITDDILLKFRNIDGMELTGFDYFCEVRYD